MAYFLGVDTGGTYTDAVIVDEAADRVIGTAKALTTRADLATGIGLAVDAALLDAGVAAGDIALVSLSTTLATNEPHSGAFHQLAGGGGGAGVYRVRCRRS